METVLHLFRFGRFGSLPKVVVGFEILRIQSPCLAFVHEVLHHNSHLLFHQRPGQFHFQVFTEGIEQGRLAPDLVVLLDPSFKLRAQGVFPFSHGGKLAHLPGKGIVQLRQPTLLQSTQGDGRIVDQVVVVIRVFLVLCRAVVPAVVFILVDVVASHPGLPHRHANDQGHKPAQGLVILHQIHLKTP